MANKMLNNQLFKKWRFWAIVVVVLGIIGLATGGGDTNNTTNTTNNSSGNSTQTGDSVALALTNEPTSNQTCPLGTTNDL